LYRLCQSAGGAYGTDPSELLALDARSVWKTATYHSGDVLLFGMKAVHGPLTPLSRNPRKIRLSTDTRWQPRSDEVDDRHTTSLGPDDGLWRARSKYGLDWARDSKALNQHRGPWMTMEDKKREWKLSPKL